MATLEELLNRRRDLDLEIAKLKAADRGAAITEIRRILATHGLSITDVGVQQAGAKGSGGTRARKPVAPKYRDASGRTWSGRGLKPKWLAQALAEGKTLEQFAVPR